MNKKYIAFSFVALLALTLVSAGLITYYGSVETTIDVTQPILVNGEISEFVTTVSIDNMAGAEPFLGDAISIENSANFPVTVQIIDDSYKTVNDGIDISYVGLMNFVDKDLVTGVEGTNTKEIVYTITGEEFIATGIPTGYKLIYYPDMDGGFAENVLNILVYGDGFPSLPVSKDIGDDYCTNPFNLGALVCNGAKLWLVENDYVDDLKLGDWDTSKILFETDLITYTASSNGKVLVPANSELIVYHNIL